MAHIHILTAKEGEITFQKKERRRIGTIPGYKLDLYKKVFGQDSLLKYKF